jgi:hypothetical protein
LKVGRLIKKFGRATTTAAPPPPTGSAAKPRDRLENARG